MNEFPQVLPLFSLKRTILESYYAVSVSKTRSRRYESTAFLFSEESSSAEVVTLYGSRALRASAFSFSMILTNSGPRGSMTHSKGRGFELKFSVYYHELARLTRN